VVAADHDDFLIIAPEADSEGAASLAQRVAQALRKAPFAARARKAKGSKSWAIGVAVCPAEGDSRTALLAHATASPKPL